MKIYKTPLKRLSALIGVTALSAVLLSSCLKTNNNNYYPPVALVTFIQASPDEPALDFYLNSDKVNVLPVNYGDNIDYFRAYAGARVANFYSAGTMNKIFSGNIQLNQNTTYSLFLANKPSQPELVLLTDSISRPSSGDATIRFVNLSPDAPAVDLAIQGGAVFVANKAYKGFLHFCPCNHKTTILLKCARQAPVPYWQPWQTLISRAVLCIPFGFTVLPQAPQVPTSWLLTLLPMPFIIKTE
jgi:hypothetical protein